MLNGNMAMPDGGTAAQAAIMKMRLTDNATQPLKCEVTDEDAVHYRRVQALCRVVNGYDSRCLDPSGYFGNSGQHRRLMFADYSR